MLSHYRTQIILHVLLLLGLVTAVVLNLNYDQYLGAGIFVILLVLAVLRFMRQLNRTHRRIAQFFSSIQYDDFTLAKAPLQSDPNLQQLQEAFQGVHQKFQSIRAEKEANHQFLQALVEQVEVGLLCLNEKEEVVLMNQALQKLLAKPFLPNLTALQKVDAPLAEIVRTLEPGERELYKVSIQNQLLQLSIQAGAIRLQGEPLKLISFQNIQNELEAQELSAWQKLIRTLTHEIMNSVAPISSLSGTINQLLMQSEELTPELREKIKRSAGIIHKRSEGLLNFTETYRSLTRIPVPQFQEVDGRKLMEELLTLMRAELEKQQIRTVAEIGHKPLLFTGDPQLLEQVLINLLKNAIEALHQTEAPQITLQAYATADHRVCLQIADNGPGIPPDRVEQVFIPFFTTKATGSGIGLSLSRQIVRQHQGQIDLHTSAAGTVVRIVI